MVYRHILFNKNVFSDKCTLMFMKCTKKEANPQTINLGWQESLYSLHNERSFAVIITEPVYNVVKYIYYTIKKIEFWVFYRPNMILLLSAHLVELLHWDVSWHGFKLRRKLE